MFMWQRVNNDSRSLHVCWHGPLRADCRGDDEEDDMSTGGTGPEDPAADLGGDPTSAQVEVAAETFRMLASGTRLRLVWTLVNQELDVSSLAEAIGAAVPTVSQHLAKMRLAGLISSRRDGRRIFYTVDDPHVVSMVREIFEHIAPDGSLAPDPPVGDSSD